MRISWIDNLKWLWMILIIIWHSLFPNGSLLFWYIFSFHVALFFFLSGYLFNDKKHKNVLLFIKEKFKRLIIPYFAFNFIFFLYERLVHTSVNHGYLSVLKWTLYGTWLRGNDEIFLLNVSTWFLVSLFCTSIIYFFINKIIKNNTFKLLFLIILSISMYYESLHLSYLQLPFSIEASVMATFFYGIWHLYQSKITHIVEKINYKYILLLPILVLINIYFLSGINFSTNEYGNNYFHFIISSFVGIFTWIIISTLIPKNWFLNFLWKNSIIILWMEFLKTRVLWYIVIFSYGYIIRERSDLNGIIQVVWTIIILIPIIFFINKFFPFILGDFTSKKKICSK